MNDFERAQQAADNFDNKLLLAGSAISSDYADLLSLTTRQILGSLDITLALGSDGKWNFSDTMVFMKNMGAAGSDSPCVILLIIPLFQRLYARYTGLGNRGLTNGAIASTQLTRFSQPSQPFFISILRSRGIYSYHF